MSFADCRYPEDVADVAAWFAATVAPCYGVGPVKVAVRNIPGLMGVASHDGGAWLLTLSGSLRGERPLKTLFHELGHVVLGHIATGPQTIATAKATDTKHLLHHAATAPGRAQREEDVDAWADREFNRWRGLAER